MARKRFYTKELGKKVATGARIAKSSKYHVVLSDGERWAVVADGNTRATKVFSSQTTAIDFAKEYATKMKGEVIIHKKTGEIEDSVSYGN